MGEQEQTVEKVALLALTDRVRAALKLAKDAAPARAADVAPIAGALLIGHAIDRVAIQLGMLNADLSAAVKLVGEALEKTPAYGGPQQFVPTEPPPTITSFGPPPGAETKTSDEWSRTVQFVDVRIADTRGWDQANFAYAWFTQQITQVEFERRLDASTVQSPVADTDTGIAPALQASQPHTDAAGLELVPVHVAAVDMGEHEDTVWLLIHDKRLTKIKNKNNTDCIWRGEIEAYLREKGELG